MPQILGKQKKRKRSYSYKALQTLPGFTLGPYNLLTYFKPDIFSKRHHLQFMSEDYFQDYFQYRLWLDITHQKQVLLKVYFEDPGMLFSIS